ncbi:hypothetical protein K504DRAFT_508177 [Pleomassaria siparia CBS 279.74]|uniref:Uncharacterized protein n=1 Tax=Pleomassaria siparia CBS 279.74 TaxID=1314801 RepID=A0A6G1JRY0_9PLEO|nr:hypothetical protein K504DRAFT_508177 [Pleomassaria siparia CBS 279.74]
MSSPEFSLPDEASILYPRPSRPPPTTVHTLRTIRRPLGLALKPVKDASNLFGFRSYKAHGLSEWRLTSLHGGNGATDSPTWLVSEAAIGSAQCTSGCEIYTKSVVQLVGWSITSKGLIGDTLSLPIELRTVQVEKVVLQSCRQACSADRKLNVAMDYLSPLTGGGGRQSQSNGGPGGPVMDNSGMTIFGVISFC